MSESLAPQKTPSCTTPEISLRSSLLHSRRPVFHRGDAKSAEIRSWCVTQQKNRRKAGLFFAR